MKKLSLFIFLAVLVIQSNAQYLNVAKNFALYNGWNGYFTMYYNNNQFTLIGKCANGVDIQPFIARFSANGDSLGFYQLKDTAKGEFYGFLNTSYRYNPVFPIYTFYDYYINNSKMEAALYRHDSLLNISLIAPIPDSISRGLGVTFETRDHHLIGAGWRQSNSTNKSYINITKVTKNGNILWERNILNTGSSCNLKDGFPLLSNNNIIVSGSNSNLPVVVCLDSAGGIAWQKYFDSNCAMAGVEPMPDSTIMVAMDTLIGMNLYGLKLQKLDPVNGNVLWDTTYNLSGSYISSSTDAFRVTSKGECIIAGQTGSYTHYYYLKINANHQVAFFHKSPQYVTVRIDDVIEYKEGGIAGCGVYVGPSPYYNYSWFFATDANGCIDAPCSTAVGMEEPEEPLSLKELSITPNPATEKATITATQAYHNASLLIFNMTGKETISYPWPEGKTTMQLDVHRFLPGTYQLILLTNTNNKEVGKLVVGR